MGPLARFWSRWWAYTTVAECAGFAVPALVGLVAWQLDAAPVPFFVALVVAGTVEGAMLGTGQQRALRHVLSVSARAWPLSTAGGAGLAWAIGMLPSTLIDLGTPLWVALVVFAPLVPEGASMAVMIAAWLTAGLVMAATVAALTGLAMVYLLDQPSALSTEAQQSDMAT